MDALLLTWPLGLIGLLSFAGLMGAWEFGVRLGSRSAGDPHRDAAHGYILSGVFGLLALLIGFTFGMALDRYETRRALVVSEANAIGTAEMRVQLLEAPAGPALSALLRDYARTRGIIIADTKFEFGLVDGQLILIDEVLTPDSSRFWPAEHYAAGRGQPSFDKQFVRDHLETLDWDKTPPAPALPADIVAKTQAKYLEAYRLLTGKPL